LGPTGAIRRSDPGVNLPSAGFTRTV